MKCGTQSKRVNDTRQGKQPNKSRLLLRYRSLRRMQRLDTVLDETVPEEELPERAIANVVDVVVSAPKKRKLLNARSNTSRKSPKTVATSSSSSFEDLPF